METKSAFFSNVEGYAKLFCVLVSEIFVNEHFISFDSIYLLLLHFSLMCILLSIKHHVTRRTLHYTDYVPCFFLKVFAKRLLVFVTLHYFLTNNKSYQMLLAMNMESLILCITVH